MKNNDDLILRNMNLAPYVITKLGLKHKMDEYIDIAWIGLCWGAKTYDETKGKESTYLYNSIRITLLHELNAENMQKRSGCEVLSLDYTYTNKSGTDMCSFADTIPNDSKDNDFLISLVEETNRLLKIMKDYSKKYRADKLLCDYFGFNTPKLKIKQIEKKYKITSRTIFDCARRFRKLLKIRLNMEG